MADLSDTEKLLLDKMDKLVEQQSKLREEIAALKAWAGAWGSLSGLLTSLLVTCFGMALKGQAK